jgi:hypothetical protein
MPLERKTPMNRGTSTLRRTPMPRGTSVLETRAQLARTKPLETRAPLAQDARPPHPRKRARNTGPSTETRAVVRKRDGNRCVRCGAPARDQDHRQGRGAGGTSGEAHQRINRPSALLTLCGNGNTSGCHRWKETMRVEAELDGYRLPRNGIQYDPETVPVRVGAQWFLFLNTGKRVPTVRPPDGDARNAGRPLDTRPRAV